MDGPPVQDAVQQLQELTRAVDDLRRRVAALEQRSAVASSSAEGSLPAAQPVMLPEVSPGLLAPIGRMLLGIAGAYLLRAIVESGILPELTGTLIGLLYAAAWLMASIRTAASNRVSLALEGLTASAIAAPLLWEATTRFHALSPAGAAAALTFFIVLGQVVAWKHDHAAIAAITALTGAITAVALIAATLDPVPFAIALLVAATVVEYGAIRDHALAWRWIIALAADFCAFLLLYLTTRPQGLPTGYAPVSAVVVIAIQIALVAVYCGSMAARTLVLRLRITWFEILQVAAVLALAIVSNWRFAYGIGGGMAAAGTACYLVAFSSSSRSRELARNFQAYATFGLILLLGGSFLVLHGLMIVALWSVLAVSATWLGEHKNQNTLSVHGAIYLLATAAVSAGLGKYWPLALAATLAYVVVLRTGREGLTLVQRIPRAVVVGMIACSLYGVGASFSSTLRTALISLIAIALGWFGKRWGVTELIWVLYPWMTFGAVKLLAEDFRQDHPAGLFLSLLVYGGTLIALPRLLREADARRTDLS
jgi:hypothetical protein